MSIFLVGAALEAAGILRGGKTGFATLSAFPLADFLRFEKRKYYI